MKRVDRLLSVAAVFWLLGMYFAYLAGGWDLVRLALAGTALYFFGYRDGRGDRA